jgi:hypothetical protein
MRDRRPRVRRSSVRFLHGVRTRDDDDVDDVVVDVRVGDARRRVMRQTPNVRIFKPSMDRGGPRRIARQSTTTTTTTDDGGRRGDDDDARTNLSH